MTGILWKAAALSLLAAGIGCGPAAARDIKTIGVTLPDLGNPFFGAISKSIDAKVREAGGPDVRVITASADFDLNKQSTQFDNFIQAGADMIIVDAVDTEAIQAAVERAKAQGIIVVTIDNIAKGAQASVSTDNVAAGRLACQFIADRLNGKGDVVIINGPAVSGVIDRVNGCREAFSGHPDIRVVSDNQRPQGTRDAGLATMQALLTAHDHIDAVFTINDPQAIGADLAAKQLGRKEFFITTVDGSPDIEESLKGDTLVAASAAQLPAEIAGKAIELGFLLASGKAPEKTDVLVMPQLVTRDNVAAYSGW